LSLAHAVNVIVYADTGAADQRFRGKSFPVSSFLQVGKRRPSHAAEAFTPALTIH
jgi:hypothetical protein